MRGRPGRGGIVAVVALVAATACAGRPTSTPVPSSTPSAIAGEPGPQVAASSPTAKPPSPPAGATTGAPAPARRQALLPAPPAASPVEVAYRLERRTSDPATAGFEALAQATLGDPRGWARAGFRLVPRPDAPFTVVLAEGPVVDALCLPYDTYGLYSCQNGPTVALNADRWRTATPKWTGTLDDYRRYLVGHEVGHLLGLHHPGQQCPAAGRPAPLMAQQSTELNGCLPNPWPLDAEVDQGRRRPADLAPPPRP
ncbi:MAG: DUF3152 domain-containing protein [Acidimicrobiales bacterium]